MISICLRTETETFAHFKSVKELIYDSIFENIIIRPTLIIIRLIIIRIIFLIAKQASGHFQLYRVQCDRKAEREQRKSL